MKTHKKIEEGQKIIGKQPHHCNIMPVLLPEPLVGKQINNVKSARKNSTDDPQVIITREKSKAAYNHIRNKIKQVRQDFEHNPQK